MSTIHRIWTRLGAVLATGSLVLAVLATATGAPAASVPQALAAVPSGHRVSRATRVKSKVDWLQFGFDSSEDVHRLAGSPVRVHERRP